MQPTLVSNHGITLIQSILATGYIYFQWETLQLDTLSKEHALY